MKGGGRLFSFFYFEIDELSKPSDTGATHDKSG